MLTNLALPLLAVFTCCDICAPIKVPVVWDSASEVKQNNPDERDEFSVDQFKPKNVKKSPIPTEYFQYTAKKPQFAVDIAAFHGVQSPENYYKSYPVRPYTGVEKPELGKHRIQEEKRPLFHNFQEYINQNEQPGSHITPTSSNYEVFHPYKAEEPGLQALYKDPVLDKIRHDIRESSQRLQKHENDAGKSEIESNEYLESVDQTDRRKFPHRNVPAPYEIHKPQRRPVYYRPIPKYSNREHILNQRFKHPWNQNFIKIRPVHYRPLKHHLHSLRQHHALTFDDEHNEYPQVPVPQHYEEPPDGYDIYSRGKEKYVQLRNNLDESVNNLVREHRPVVPQRLELQQDEKSNYDENEEEFVPIKNYAQVRKTEITKHVPKEAAFEEAETYEEIKNAPRLKQAIKSTKAQTVYTEEGYEDSAYDHAGEQKHASDHEGHGGFLRENELSGGKYKTPSLSAKYEDENGSAYRDQKIHAEKWKDNNKDTRQEEDVEDYSEDEQEHSAEADSYYDDPNKQLDFQRNKREKESDAISEQKEDINDENLSHKDKVNESESSEDDSDRDHINSTTVQHDVNKREASFKVPDINLNSTFLNERDILEIAKEKLLSKNNLKSKYPYYFKNLETIHKDSPLRYAENLKLMPKKSKGGTEFYDSRSNMECLEVDDKVDAIPEKFNKEGHPDDQESGRNSKSDTNNVQPRLQGLGDKIDCFKAKYFGENPLDSPFFQEDIISNPEPITAPNLPIFKLKTIKDNSFAGTANNVTIKIKEIDKIKIENDKDKFNDYLAQENQRIKAISQTNNEDNKNLSETHSNVNTDVIINMKDHINPTINTNKTEVTAYFHGNTSDISPVLHSVPYKFFKNIDDVIKSPIRVRRKRSAPFIYEPYKIIRDIQNPDTKKTTTTSNISPLIKQLQSSKVIDVVLKPNQDKQPQKRNFQSRTYKDIGKKDREISLSTEVDSSDSSFVDVSVDQRRGEPRYELRPSNHKHQYSPVENKKAMSLEDYETFAKKSLNPKIMDSTKSLAPQSRRYNTNSTTKTKKAPNSAASNTDEKTVTSSPKTKLIKEIQASSEESDEDYDEEYDEYDDEVDENEEEAITSSATTSTTTTTTIKPVIRRRTRSTTTTENPDNEDFKQQPKLRLVTKFRDSPHYDKQKTVQPENHLHKVSMKLKENNDSSKYREKKKKSSESTLVTDTKKYGEDNDDMRKEEIDALIGVQHDMDEYIPLYEKEAEQKNKKYGKQTNNEEASDESDDDYDEDNEDEDENDDVSEEDYDNENDNISEHKIPTTEKPERTLMITTDAPESITTEVKSIKLQTKPRIIKKKIEIHKELPVNKSSPHVTQFKQDIKEVEIIKEIPRKNTPQNMLHENLEVLDLYKDDNLAKDINKLGAVEIFKEDFDLKRGPKHGGNYKRAPELEVTTHIPKTTLNRVKGSKDAEVSQTEDKKLIELEDDIPTRTIHGGNSKSSMDMNHFKNNFRNAKQIELSELSNQPESELLHDGNLKAMNYKQRRRESKSDKLIELNDGSDENQNYSAGHMHGGNYKSYPRSKTSVKGSIQDGNHRNAKLVRDESLNEEDKNTHIENVKGDTSKDLRSKSAVLLNSFAQVVPILTTTPAYILDPSKRMYYYVDN